MVKYGTGAITAFLICYAAWIGEPTWAALALLAGVSGLSLQLLLRKHSPVSWSVAIVAFYFLYFCIHPFIASQLIDGSEDMLMRSQTAEALVWATIGIAVFSAAALYSYGLASVGTPSEAPIIGGPFVVLRDFRVLLLFVVIGGVGIVYTIVNGYFGLAIKVDADKNLSGLAIVAWSFFDVTFAVAWIQYFSSRKSRWLLFAVPLLFVYATIALFSKSKGAFMAPLLVVSGAYLMTRKRLPVAWIVAGIVFYVGFAYPYVTTWRQQGRTQYHTRIEMAEEGFDLLQSGKWIGATESAGAKSATVSLGRGLLTVFTAIVTQTGVSTTAEAGDTYLTAFKMMVPRILWNDKPPTNLGNMVGHKYEFIADNDDITNISPTLMGEMYMNFEGSGVLIGMILLGILAGFVDAKAGTWWGRWFLVWSWPASFAGQEGLVAHLVPGFVKEFTAILIVCVFLRAIIAGNVLPGQSARLRRRLTNSPVASQA